MRKGNPNLKRAHTPLEVTPEQIAEYAKCMRDPTYFIKRYIYITHAVQGSIRFSMYDYQEEMVRDYQNNRYNIVLSSRQTGKTETSCAYLLWFAIFHESKTVLVVSKDSEAAMEIIKKIQDAYELLPHWLKPGVTDDNWNKHTAEFDNKSRIIARTTTQSSGRGLAISLLYCDELAFVKPHVQNEFWDSVFPTLSTGGSCIISSTPNGDTNLFAKLWKDAEADINGFNPIRVYWYQAPGRGEEYKQDMINKLGEQKWLQEFECEFISSDNSLFNTRIIQIAQRKFVDVKHVFQISDKLKFFKPLSRNMTYLVGVDPSTGNGNDQSVIQVFEFPTMKQVLECSSNTVNENELYALLKTVVNFVSGYASNVYFSIESNGVGRALIALYMQDASPPAMATFMSETGKNKLGYHTTNSSKVECAIRFKNMFETGGMEIYSPILYNEMKSYIRKAAGFEAQRGSTDDCISAVFVILRMINDLAKFDQNAYNKLYSFVGEPHSHGPAVGGPAMSYNDGTISNSLTHGMARRDDGPEDGNFTGMVV